VGKRRFREKKEKKKGQKRKEERGELVQLKWERERREGR